MTQSIRSRHAGSHSRVKLPQSVSLTSKPTQLKIGKLTSHFLYPVFLSFDFGAALLAIFGSLFFTYSCASAAHTFL